MDFATDLKRLVEDTARRVAEEVLTHSLTAIIDLRSRAEALVCEAEAVESRRKVALAFVEAAQKAGAVPFIGAADRTDFSTVEVDRDGYFSVHNKHLGPFFLEASNQLLGAHRIEPGRYSVVLSLYRQGRDR